MVVMWEVGVEGSPCELAMSVNYCVHRLVTSGVPTGGAGSRNKREGVLAS